MLRRGFLTAVVLSLAVPCLATPLSPGTTVAAVALMTPAGETLLADNVNLPWISSSGGSHGTLSDAVYRNAGGTLDFVYQVTNSANSLLPLVRETDSSFLGYLTDVNYLTNGSALPGGVFADGTAFPMTADRSAAGDVVGFSFTDIEPGVTSQVLFIRTNAMLFGAGSVSLVDGSAGTALSAGFEPIPILVATPEPASPLLLGTGLIGVGAARRWRSRRQLRH